MTRGTFRPLIATTVAAGLLAVAAVATAQHAGGERPKLPISTVEMQQKVIERSVAIDADGDGFITLDEVRAYREAQRQQRAQEHFGKFDSDGDGRVSVAEFEAKQLERIDRLDANKDGQVDRAEFAHARMHQRMTRRGGGD